MMVEWVIGIDQSYKRTGITILKNKYIIDMISVDYKVCNSNSEKRVTLRNTLEGIMSKHDIKNPLVLTERIRLRSQGFLSEAYIKSTGALVATIIDFFYYCDEIPVYSVDTRFWKSQIVGSSKPLENKYGIDPKKYRTILYMKSRGFLKYIVEEYKGKGTKGVIHVKINGQKVPCKVNDDLADSYCIAMCGYLPKNKQKFKEENF